MKHIDWKFCVPILTVGAVAGFFESWISLVVMVVFLMVIAGITIWRTQ